MHCDLSPVYYSIERFQYSILSRCKCAQAALQVALIGPWARGIFKRSIVSTVTHMMPGIRICTGGQQQLHDVCVALLCGHPKRSRRAVPSATLGSLCAYTEYLRGYTVVSNGIFSRLYYIYRVWQGVRCTKVCIREACEGCRFAPLGLYPCPAGLFQEPAGETTPALVESQEHATTS